MLKDNCVPVLVALAAGISFLGCLGEPMLHADVIEEQDETEIIDHHHLFSYTRWIYFNSPVTSLRVERESVEILRLECSENKDCLWGLYWTVKQCGFWLGENDEKWVSLSCEDEYIDEETGIVITCDRPLAAPPEDDICISSEDEEGIYEFYAEQSDGDSVYLKWKSEWNRDPDGNDFCSVSAVGNKTSSLLWLLI